MYKHPLTSHSQRKWKKNGTDKYDFLRKPWSWDSKNFVKPLLYKILLRSPAECPANRNILFRLYRFSFHKPIRSRLVRGRLCMLNQRYGLHHKICKWNKGNYYLCITCYFIKKVLRNPALSFLLSVRRCSLWYWHQNVLTVLLRISTASGVIKR